MRLPAVSTQALPNEYTYSIAFSPMSPTAACTTVEQPHSLERGVFCALRDWQRTHPIKGESRSLDREERRNRARDARKRRMAETGRGVVNGEGRRSLKFCHETRCIGVGPSGVARVLAEHIEYVVEVDTEGTCV